MSQLSPLDQVITIPEAVELYGLIPSTWQTACRLGKVTCRRSGKRWLILKTSAEWYTSITIGECAKIFDVSYQYLNRLVRLGEVEGAYKQGKRWYLSVMAVKRALERDVIND